LEFTLPFEAGAEYSLIMPGRHRVSVESQGVDVSRQTFLRAAADFVRWLVAGRRRKASVGGIKITAIGSPQGRRLFSHFLKATRFASIINQSSDIIEANRRRAMSNELEARDVLDRRTRETTGKRSGVIVCHLFYMEAIPEILRLIRPLSGLFDVIFTIGGGVDREVPEELRSLPNCQIFRFENMGRDIRPFLCLLEDGVLDGYDFICKIHEKLSKKAGARSGVGELWRRLMYSDLLGSAAALVSVLNRLESNADIGMIGPAAYRCPGRVFSKKARFGGNEQAVRSLMGFMNIEEPDRVPDFFAGSMFWIRREALEPIRGLKLANTYFEPERGLLDGAPEHAVERLFGASVVKAGFRIEDVESEWLLLNS
jgi:lipopolysaccharide biosynthesis protein